jgi:hypothetical protein
MQTPRRQPPRDENSRNRARCLHGSVGDPTMPGGDQVLQSFKRTSGDQQEEQHRNAVLGVSKREHCAAATVGAGSTV